jgi:putative transposase
MKELIPNQLRMTREPKQGTLKFQEASKVFFTKTLPRTKHIREISLIGSVHNNKMERMNGELRDREKVIRGVKSMRSPIFKGTKIFHNYIRPHMSLKDQQTPAEASGIKVEGLNKWMTLIQNASKNEIRP